MLHHRAVILRKHNWITALSFAACLIRSDMPSELRKHGLLSTELAEVFHTPQFTYRYKVIISPALPIHVVLRSNLVSLVHALATP